MPRFYRDDIDKFMDYDIYLATRTIYMGSQSSDDSGESGTDYEMAERLIKGLHILDNQNDKPITILMNNLGGDEVHGMAIYDAIKGCRSYITIIVYGYAMSMGSIILQAADKRVMTPNSELMIHYGNATFRGHQLTAIKEAERQKEFNLKIEKLYLEKIKETKPDFTIEMVRDLMKFDTYFNPEQALEYGLIDKIEGEND